MDLGLYRTRTASVSINTTGVKLAFAPVSPIDVIRFGFVCVFAASANGTIQILHRPTAGDAGTEVLIDSFTILTAGRPAGSVNFKDLAQPLKVLPGGQVILNVSVIFGSTNATCFVDYQPGGFHKRNVSSGYYARLLDGAPGNG